MKKQNLLLLGMLVTLCLSMLTGIAVKGEISTLQSYKATIIPTIDGTFTETEWADAYHTSFYHEPNPMSNHPNDTVHIYIKHTENKLFLLFDDLPDNTSDQFDDVHIYYDCNFDGQRDDNISMRLGRFNNGLIGDSMANWSFGFGDSPNKAEDHTIIEISINITFSDNYDGSSRPEEMNHILPVGNLNGKIRIIFDASPQVSDWLIPQNGVIGDPTTYAELTLTPPQNIPFVTPLLVSLILGISTISMGWTISRKKLAVK